MCPISFPCHITLLSANGFQQASQAPFGRVLVYERNGFWFLLETKKRF
uniref:Uncharacterized protein n=1 Tax=Arundo donax TaxID=35708 RepID=A0A0A9F7P1_ARUDO